MAGGGKMRLGSDFPESAACLRRPEPRTIFASPLTCMNKLAWLSFSAFLTATALGQGVGYTDTPQIRGQKWKVHDKERPNPPTITPGASFSNGAPPPSDAIVLFDGRDFSHWTSGGREPK